MFRTSVLAIVALAGGCVRWTGLDQVAVDEDRDGWLDDADNCPTAANPDQYDFDLDGVGDVCDDCESASGADIDGDGVDDACDSCVGPGETGMDVGNDLIDDGCQQACPASIGFDVDSDGVDDACDDCPRGPPHDEDGDTVADGCDACPSVVDPQQLQMTDFDRLGDACDPDSDPYGMLGTGGLQAPRMFDAFNEPGHLWETRAPLKPPTVAGGKAHLAAAQTITVQPNVSRAFLVMTRTTLMPTSTSNVTLALAASNCTTSPCPRTSCVLSGDGQLDVTGFYGTTWSATAVIDTSGPVTLWFRANFDRLEDTIFPVACVAIDHKGVVTKAMKRDEPMPADYSYALSVSAGEVPVELDYVWLVNN